MTIFTIGHSTKTQEEFIELLKTYNISTLIDVRSYPGSRYVPDYNKENMEVWLKDAGIHYQHMPILGGRRKVDKTIDEKSVAGWSNQSFRNYAAYSLSQVYRDGIEQLKELSKNNQIAIMCSEAVPWRCHRLLVSNTLVYQGMKVEHIMTKKKTITHTLGLYGAKPEISDNEIIYPKAD